MLNSFLYNSLDTDCCTRQCCGPSRPFEMKILDNLQREVIHLSRPLRCSSCWFPCCLQEIEIQSPPGTVLGYCSQSWVKSLFNTLTRAPKSPYIAQLVGGYFGGQAIKVPCLKLLHPWNKKQCLHTFKQTKYETNVCSPAFCVKDSSFYVDN